MRALKLLEVPLSKVQWTNFNRLAYWGLVEPSKREDGKRKAGFWNITRKGVDFLLHGALLPSTAITYRNRVVGFEGDLIAAGDAFVGWPSFESTLLDAEPGYLGSNVERDNHELRGE